MQNSLKRLRKYFKMPSIETFFILLFLAFVAIDIRSFAMHPWASARHFWLCVLTFWLAVITFDLNKERFLGKRQMTHFRKEGKRGRKEKQDSGEETGVELYKDVDSAWQLL